MDRIKRRASLSWAFLGLLAALCSVLAVLQYRWIGEVSRAERDRLQDALRSSLNRLSRDFNLILTTAAAALVPEPSQVEELGRAGAYSARYRQWDSATDAPIFRRIGVAVPQDGALLLETLDLRTGIFSSTEWPADWAGMRDRLQARLNGGPPPDNSSEPALIEVPRMARMPSAPPMPGRPRMPGPAPPRIGEQDWLILELDLDYARSATLPNLIHQHLGFAGQAAARTEYRAEVVVAADPSIVIYRSDAERGVEETMDGAVSLFDINYADLFPRGGPERGRRLRQAFHRDEAFLDSGRGRWQLRVQHQAGSLDAIVSGARWRQLAVSAGILFLMVATGAVLVRYSRKSQQLAEQQISFVASVSHELRTPLTVIRTAAFNLRGRLASKPEQVEKYGKLIQQESEKLTGMVEQILRFASSRAGHVIREREPVAIEDLIEDGLGSNRAALEGARVVVDKQVEPALPLVLADELAMKHVLQNLLDNAMKYGLEGSNWIGISASKVADEKGDAVEIRVADRGPGIPAEEQEHIFDPFFRGRRALQDQVHGTGLGLNLVKKIVEAHGGSIHVRSQPANGTEFVVRIPAAPAELQNEFAHSTD